MMAKCSVQCGVVALAVLVAHSFAARADDVEVKTVLCELVRSKDRNDIRHHLSYHAASEWKSGYKDDSGKIVKYSLHHLLVISWFRDGGRTALRYTVTEKGESQDVRSVYNHAEQANHDRQLSPGELTRLKKILTTLPKETSDPPIDRTVHVSYLEDKKWQTVTYDADKLPAAIEQVFDLLGERFETKERHQL